MLGQHTAEVLAELGFAEDAVAKFSDAGVVGTLAAVEPARGEE
jgi:hypothetical protein